MKKIVFVISEMGIGGAETIFHDAALGLSRHKDEYDISVICLYDRGRIGRRLSGKGVELHDRILRNRFDVKGLLRFIDILKRKKPDILYIAGQTLTEAVCFLASIVVKVPVKVIAVHSHDLAHRAPYRMLIDRVVFGSAAHIVCVSQSQKEHIAFTKNVPAKKIKVIYNSVDADRFRSDAKTSNGFSVPEGSVVIGVLASLRKEKGLDVLMQAVPRVLACSPNAYFVIAGDGTEKNKLEDMAKRSGAYPNIRFLGEREDTPDIVPLFDIGCLSSRTECFPLALLEYMACGKPVVASNVGGVPEMVKDGVSGFLVRPGSPDDLAEKLISLIEDKGLRISMGKEGKKIVEKSFTLDKMLDGYGEFFRGIEI